MIAVSLWVLFFGEGIVLTGLVLVGPSHRSGDANFSNSNRWARLGDCVLCSPAPKMGIVPEWWGSWTRLCAEGRWLVCPLSLAPPPSVREVSLEGVLSHRVFTQRDGLLCS